MIAQGGGTTGFEPASSRFWRPLASTTALRPALGRDHIADTSNQLAGIEPGTARERISAISSAITAADRPVILRLLMITAQVMFPTIEP